MGLNYVISWVTFVTYVKRIHYHYYKGRHGAEGDVLQIWRVK
jgi:hypothetical protein